MIRRSDVYRLESGAVVTVIDQPVSNQVGVNCMVIGGGSTTYTTGGYNLYVFLEELTKERRLKL